MEYPPWAAEQHVEEGRFVIRKPELIHTWELNKSQYRLIKRPPEYGQRYDSYTIQRKKDGDLPGESVWITETNIEGGSPLSLGLVELERLVKCGNTSTSQSNGTR